MVIPAPVLPAAARRSPYLGIVLREIEHSGSGSAHFWRVFGAALPHLSDGDLERVALACGERGRAWFGAVTENTVDEAGRCT